MLTWAARTRVGLKGKDDVSVSTELTDKTSSQTQLEQEKSEKCSKLVMFDASGDGNVSTAEQMLHRADELPLQSHHVTD